MSAEKALPSSSSSLLRNI